MKTERERVIISRVAYLTRVGPNDLFPDTAAALKAYEAVTARYLREGADLIEAAPLTRNPWNRTDARPVKVANIPDAVVLEAVARVNSHDHRFANVQHVFDVCPDFPRKVVMAKIRQMINKGRLIGCGCGCRGDLAVPKGRI